jgi:hypothetical protein
MKQKLIDKYEGYINECRKWFDLPDIPRDVLRAYRGRIFIYEEVITDLKSLPDESQTM